MKALSLWQPWASLVAFGEKKVETRIWKTSYRGPIAIASTKAERPLPGIGMSRDSKLFQEYFRLASERHGWGARYWPEKDREGWNVCPPDLRRALCGFGAVLCTAELVAIEETSAVRDDLDEKERVFGNYEDGRYAWFLENVKRFDRPIPVKGNRMLWKFVGEVSA